MMPLSITRTYRFCVVHGASIQFTERTVSSVARGLVFPLLTRFKPCSKVVPDRAAQRCHPFSLDVRLHRVLLTLLPFFVCIRR